MIFSLIGLSTTVLMVAEAFMMATPGLNPIWGYLIVIGPVAVFAGLCRLYKNGDTQLKMAAVCSLLYRKRSKRWQVHQFNSLFQLVVGIAVKHA